jgi:capsular polysaccharide biosynthesis protein
VIQPVLEQTMSTGVSTTDRTELDVSGLAPPTMRHETPVFYFLYNTTNYFHYLYDSLPYLVGRPEGVPLLMERPRYPFVMDCLEALGIRDIVYVDPNTIYSTVLVSSSLTHEGLSDAPPHPDIWSLYRRMTPADIPTPPKIYVSRRSWIHGDKSNLGSDYTERRKMLCEDALVEGLNQRGYVEVFCERLTMAEKIAYFSKAKNVVGAIGGGMCNLVFARPSCKVACIASPEFERINSRFLHTMSHTNLTMYRDTESASLLYRRVRLPTGEIGELVAEDRVCLGNGVTWVAGQGREVTVDVTTLTFLDAGLNSPWRFHVESFLQTIE